MSARAVPAPDRSGRDARSVTADDVVGAAAIIVERHGSDALTMRRLSDDLGVAVTSIYWHVGNRDAVLDALVDRLLADVRTIRPEGDSPAERIASMCRVLRTMLVDRSNVMAVVHQRDRMPEVFHPVQAAFADELAALDVRGAPAATVIRSFEAHVVSSALLERSRARNSDHELVDPDLWPADHPDRALVDALGSPTDFDVVFEYGLAALLATLPTPSQQEATP